MFRSKESKLRKLYFNRNGGLLVEERRQKLMNNSEGGSAPTIFSYKELKMATNDFSPNNKLGKAVFRGKLQDDREVAIKKSKIEAETQKELQSYINEVFILSQINHENIVKFLGCCLETEIPLLVYEFVPNKELSHHLRLQKQGPNPEFPLTWNARLKIAIEIAAALAHLHPADSLHFYHRDVKSANILLDERRKAKLADFGISKSVMVNQTHVTTRVVGTDGYVDPEYQQTRHYSHKSDVYSFGVVLVELLTGRVATEQIRMDNGVVRRLGTHFLNYVEAGRLMNIVDSRVKQEAREEAIEAVANLAKRCLSPSGKLRPAMVEVGAELQRVKLLPLNGPN